MTNDSGDEVVGLCPEQGAGAQGSNWARSPKSQEPSRVVWYIGGVRSARWKNINTGTSMRKEMFETQLRAGSGLVWWAKLAVAADCQLFAVCVPDVGRRVLLRRNTSAIPG